MSCTVGICSGIPQKSQTLKEYFLIADNALYQAKNTHLENLFSKKIAIKLSNI